MFSGVLVVAALSAGVLIWGARPAHAAPDVVQNLPVRWIVVAVAAAIALALTAILVMTRRRRRGENGAPRGRRSRSAHQYQPATADELAARVFAQTREAQTRDVRAGDPEFAAPPHHAAGAEDEALILRGPVEDDETADAPASGGLFRRRRKPARKPATMEELAALAGVGAEDDAEGAPAGRSETEFEEPEARIIPPQRRDETGDTRGADRRGPVERATARFGLKREDRTPTAASASPGAASPAAASPSGEVHTEVFDAALAAGHAGIVYWTADGGAIVSPRLAALLGLETGDIETPEQTLDGFDAAGRAEVGAALGRLREFGEGFSSIVRDAEGARYFQVVGRRSGRPEAPVDIMWVQNVTDRIAALVHLERQSNRLRGLLDAIPVPIWERDASLRITDCNRAYVDAVEAEAPEAVFAECREFVEGAAADKARELARQAIETGEAREGSHNIVVSGARRNYLIHEAPRAGGAATAGFALDRTEIEELRGELDRHQKAQEDILDRLALAIMVFGDDRHLRFVNSAAAKLWKLDETWLDTGPEIGEVLDVLREKRLLPETGDFSAFKREWRSYFTKLIEPREELLHLPNSTAVWMVISPHPKGGLLVTFEDVTDKLRLERSYNTLVDVQQATLNNLAEGVAVFGEDGTLRLTNPVFRELWDLSEAFVETNPHLSEVVEACKAYFDYGNDWEGFKSAYLSRIFGRVMRNGRINTTDDKVLAYSIVPMPDGGVLISYRDITDSTRVERALRERNDALEAADRLKSEFVANVSYELRSPLTTILGFAEILNNQYFGALNDKQAEYLGSMISASRKLQGLINDIIDLSVIEAGRMQLEIGAFDVRELLDGLDTLMRARAAERNVRVEVDCPADIGVVEGDARRLRQVLYNLLLNAVTYSPHGGQVILSARRRGDRILLAVADQGPGIDSADQAHVFDPFVRGLAADRRYQGAGLGLSLVRRFVELHGGTVELESAPGQGTRVVCVLPARRGGRETPPGGRARPGTDRGARRDQEAHPTRAAAE